MILGHLISEKKHSWLCKTFKFTNSPFFLSRILFISNLILLNKCNSLLLDLSKSSKTSSGFLTPHRDTHTLFWGQLYCNNSLLITKGVGVGGLKFYLLKSTSCAVEQKELSYFSGSKNPLSHKFQLHLIDQCFPRSGNAT